VKPFSPLDWRKRAKARAKKKFSQCFVCRGQGVVLKRCRCGHEQEGKWEDCPECGGSGKSEDMKSFKNLGFLTIEEWEANVKKRKAAQRRKEKREANPFKDKVPVLKAGFKLLNGSKWKTIGDTSSFIRKKELGNDDIIMQVEITFGNGVPLSVRTYVVILDGEPIFTSNKQMTLTSGREEAAVSAVWKLMKMELASLGAKV